MARLRIADVEQAAKEGEEGFKDPHGEADGDEVRMKRRARWTISFSPPDLDADHDEGGVGDPHQGDEEEVADRLGDVDGRDG